MVFSTRSPSCVSTRPFRLILVRASNLGLPVARALVGQLLKLVLPGAQPIRTPRTHMAFAASGKQRRLARLFRHPDGRTVILPIDDGLIAGPSRSLSDLPALFSAIRPHHPDGVLLFPGVLNRHWRALTPMAAIVNVTASTTHVTHTRKVLCADVETALAAGADLVAVHVNVTSRYEHAMLATLRSVLRRSEALGLPVLAIMYPRREGEPDDDNYQDLKHANPPRYTQLVAHAARIGMELGADVIKTPYTGSPETFATVVDAIRPVPVVIAGGPLCSEAQALSDARGAVAAGAHGVSFGRNVFDREDPARMLQLLHSAVHVAVPRPTVTPNPGPSVTTVD